MDPYEANEIDLTTFSPVLANYGPKGIYAPAALVTEDNIGQIALQFERDVLYPFPNGSGIPYIRIMASRTTDEPIELNIAPGFWIVLIWNEIHIFKDGLFQKTFQIDISTEPEKGLTKEEFEDRLEAVSKHIAEPAIPRVGPDYHAGSLYKSEGQDPSFYAGAIDQEQMEVRTSNWSGKKILMRPGVYDQLSDEAKKMFGWVEELRKLADAGSLELYDASTMPSSGEAEKTQFIPIGPRSEMIHTGTADNVPKTNAEKVSMAREKWEAEKDGPIVTSNEERTSLGYEELRGNGPVNPLN